jgi:hypothetical protein
VEDFEGAEKWKREQKTKKKKKKRENQTLRE